MVYSYGRALTPRCSRTEPDEEDVTALELEVKGVCEPRSGMLQPYAIHIPGQLMMQTATKRQFRVRPALAAATFCFSCKWNYSLSSSILVSSFSVIIYQILFNLRV